jgi:hypothetical protein
MGKSHKVPQKSQTVPTQKQDDAPENQNLAGSVTDADGNTTPANVNSEGESPTDAPQVQEQSQGPGKHETPVQTEVSANPPTEAELTREGGDPTSTQLVGGADATADPTADGAVSQAENTLPQSPVHQGDLTSSDKKDIVDEFNKPGAQVASIAEKHGVSSERVFEVVDQHNDVEA